MNKQLHQLVHRVHNELKAHTNPDLRMVASGVFKLTGRALGVDDVAAYLVQPLQADGTSEGAEKGWETRKEGGWQPMSKEEAKEKLRQIRSSDKKAAIADQNAAAAKTPEEKEAWEKSAKAWRSGEESDHHEAADAHRKLWNATGLKIGEDVSDKDPEKQAYNDREEAATKDHYGKERLKANDLIKQHASLHSDEKADKMQARADKEKDTDSKNAFESSAKAWRSGKVEDHKAAMDAHWKARDAQAAKHGQMSDKVASHEAQWDAHRRVIEGQSPYSSGPKVTLGTST